MNEGMEENNRLLLKRVSKRLHYTVTKQRVKIETVAGACSSSLTQSDITISRR